MGTFRFIHRCRFPQASRLESRIVRHFAHFPHPYESPRQRTRAACQRRTGKHQTEMSAIRPVFLLFAAAYTGDVLAQELNATVIWLFVGAPVSAIVLTLFAGIVTRSWKVVMIGLGSVLFWMAWYWLAAQFAQADILFWIPIAAIHLQLPVLIAWLWWKINRRLRA